MAEFVLNDSEIAWQIVDEEVVLIHIPTSFYYSINRTGTYLWNRLNTRAYSSAELSDLLSRQYQVDSTITRPATQEFIDALLADDLIIEHEAPPELHDAAAGETTVPTSRYEKPVLAKYEQLEKVLVSGE